MADQYPIFLSYSKDDRATARRLANVLERPGREVFWDRTIAPGKRYDQVILDALNAARCVVVLWSRYSVASEWVLDEAEHGRRRNILVPVLIDDATVPLGFGRLQTIPLVNWQATATDPNFKALQDAVEMTVDHTAPDAASTPAGPVANSANPGPRADLPDHVRDPYGHNFGRVDTYYSRPSAWHCIYCGWFCQDSNNCYYCMHCTATRPFFGESATGIQCNQCAGFSLGIARFCEWCGNSLLRAGGDGGPDQ